MSLPAPPEIVSLPAPAKTESFPDPALIRSLPFEPQTTSFPAPELTVWLPVPRTTITSTPLVPLMVRDDETIVASSPLHSGVAANAAEGIPSKLTPKATAKVKLEIRMLLAETDILLTSPL